MKAYCQVCHKELKETDWVKLDLANRLTHCTCTSLRTELIKDLDTYKNIKSKHLDPQLEIA
jgi:hypothetical protein